MDGEASPQIIFLLLLSLFFHLLSGLSWWILVVAALLGVSFFMPKVSLINPSLDLLFLFMQDELVTFVSANALDKMVLPNRFSALGWTRWFPLFLYLLLRDISFGVIRPILSLLGTEGISLSECHGI